MSESNYVAPREDAPRTAGAKQGDTSRKTDRPILFSGPMVRVLLDGRKTQTRRILKPQPTECPVDRFNYTGTVVKNGYSAWESWRNDRPVNAFKAGEGCVTCLIDIPYEKGDQLWVRETISFERKWTGTKPRDVPKGERVWYWADGQPTDGDWTKPIVAIHMPRWCSRLTNTVTDVRVERLADIDEIDAMAEGIIRYDADEFDDAEFAAIEGGDIYSTAVDAYQALWNCINGALAWAANPWVVAVTFSVREGNIDEAGEQVRSGEAASE